VSDTGVALGSLEIPGVDELPEDASHLSVADVDRWSNIGARESSPERPRLSRDRRRGRRPCFDDLSASDDGEIRSEC
jgi:hypothetical protein